MAAFVTPFSLIRALSPRPPLTSARRPRQFCVPPFRMSSTDTSGASVGKMPAGKDAESMSDSDWRSVLTREEYSIIRKKGTEYPGTGEYDSFYPKEGHFVCRACGNPLYSAESKFKSGCGWPAFDKCYRGGVAIERDASLGMVRTEILCAKCGGHLGHVFEGERFTQTNERHCVNSVSVKYVDGKYDGAEAKVL
ncbi:Peptide methionine sulfoxide reductase B5 [Gracilariopsis chorda]|uniref:Peptide-methionine (R)-S-oxide reductase n=1 Tax=Gracilariopsis chorda TaxID=448386 RepID=A0A2V3IM65_9FLOR|nr:Peptide methionine sulfoxide reductase B5 [Gracilariopsis chorda]|eukprot:PXF43174.1 Peptide methionine sulfoxide reductase B5 [Gracilariopsis chorda]